MEKSWDLAIIGGGPAGLAAALYASRAGVKTVLFESLAIGGQAALSPLVVNYPGITAASGLEITADIQKQCESFGTEFVYKHVSNIDLIDKNKVLYLEDGEKVQVSAVIICTGSKARKLGLNEEDKFIGRGISYCATCDGNFFKNKDVVIVGGGNTAVTDAIYLQSLANKVYIVYRGEKLRATSAICNKLSEYKNPEVIYNSVIKSLYGDRKIEKVQIENLKTKAHSEIICDGVFVAIGYEPENKLFFQSINMDDDGYIIVDECGRTNIDGVFAAGDVTNGKLKQIVTATASGAIAGEYASKYIMEKEK